MPIFNVKAPDGSEYKIEAPEGTSQDSILQAAAEHHKHNHHSHHKHDAKMESNHSHKHHKHDAKGGENIENQVTKNVINHSNNVAKDAANTASAVTTAAKSIK